MRGLLAALGVAIGGEARADAQHYEQIRVDVGMTGSSVSVSDRNGVGFVTEIKANLHDNVAIGGRVEFGVMFGGLVEDNELPFGMAACGLVKGEYLLGTGPVRPFVGFGAGVYSIASYAIIDDEGNSRTESTVGRYVGVAPAIGVDLGRLRLAATYHAILGTSVEYRSTTAGIESRQTLSQSYLALEASLRFGGDRKQPAAMNAPPARIQGGFGVLPR